MATPFYKGPKSIGASLRGKVFTRGNVPGTFLLSLEDVRRLCRNGVAIQAVLIFGVIQDCWYEIEHVQRQTLVLAWRRVWSPRSPSGPANSSGSEVGCRVCVIRKKVKFLGSWAFGHQAETGFQITSSPLYVDKLRTSKQTLHDFAPSNLLLELPFV